MKDVTGIRNAQDLERKYDLASLGILKENFELQKQGLIKVENELNGFVKNTIKNLEELQNQVDGNITTWFFNGVPAIDKKPSNEWNTDKDKINHLGDLYYDQETGYAYRWAYENDNYIWSKIVDADVVKALAVANAAQDTADSKRRIFVDNPETPYDIGDLWIKNEELYRCQIGKNKDESYAERDWIIATKYTDDTRANEIDGKLTIVSGTVTEIKDNVNNLTKTITNTTKIVDDQGKTIGTLQEKQSKTEQTVDGFEETISSQREEVSTIRTDLNNNYTNTNELNQKIEDAKNSTMVDVEAVVSNKLEEWQRKTINYVNDNGVSKLVTGTVTIDINGVNIARSDKDIVNKMTYQGQYVSDGVLSSDNSNLLMRVDSEGAMFKTTETKGTIKEQSLIQKESIVHPIYGKCQAHYWIGG